MRASERRDVASIFEAHLSAVSDLAYRETGSLSDADDVVQNVMLRLCRVRGEIREPGAWLARVTRNEASRFRSSRRMVDVSIDDVSLSVPSRAESDYASGQSLSVLAEALEELPARDRSILVRVYEDGATVASVARRLGVHRRTIERARKRCLDALRPALKKS